MCEQGAQRKNTFDFTSTVNQKGVQKEGFGKRQKEHISVYGQLNTHELRGFSLHNRHVYIYKFLYTQNRRCSLCTHTTSGDRTFKH